jgi:hypothetical protein
VRICLDKSFSLMDCEKSHAETCAMDEPINFYPHTTHAKTPVGMHIFGGESDLGML